MLTRVCLIAAIVFAVAVGTINLVQVRKVIVETRQDRDNERSMKEQAQAELADTRDKLGRTEEDLAQTKQTLETTTTERDRLRTENNSLTTRNRQLDGQLKQTTQERDDAQAELAAWNALGISVDQVKQVIAAAKEAQDLLEIANEENRILENELRKTRNRLARYEDPNYKVPLPVNLKGTVLVADPKWEFVVLDIGEDQGVLEDGELLVNRGGRLVAKIRIQSVQKDRSIGNLVAGWKLADVAEGDLVIPAL